MAKLDAYLRSIEKFGAAGAVLTSGQPVTLRFPSGDRNATQVTGHDQLVGMVRELAPPHALDTIDQQRPARFDIDSEGRRYTVSVAPRPGLWQVTIEPASPGAVASAPPHGVTVRVPVTPPAGVPIDVGGDMSIERGQFDGAPTTAPVATSGSTTLDALVRGARSARATDIYLAAGSVPMHRVGGELVRGSTPPMDADAIARELGVVATADARAGWSEQGIGTFAYSDAGGRVRVRLGRDRRGPTAALRLLPDEAPGIDQLNLGKVAEWLGSRGLVLVVGRAGAGKTLALGALVRALGDHARRVITIEEPIELVHGAPSISQRAVGEHVPSMRAGTLAAVGEGADAIALGEITTADGAAALLDAVFGGQLVLATVTAPEDVLLDRIVALLDDGTRELARAVLQKALVGTVRVVVGRGGARTYETSTRPG